MSQKSQKDFKLFWWQEAGGCISPRDRSGSDCNQPKVPPVRKLSEDADFRRLERALGESEDKVCYLQARINEMESDQKASDDRFAILLQEHEATKQCNREFEASLAASQANVKELKASLLDVTKQSNEDLEKSLASSTADVRRYIEAMKELEDCKLRNGELEVSVKKGQDDLQELLSEHSLLRQSYSAVLQELEVSKTRNRELNGSKEDYDALLQEIDATHERNRGDMLALKDTHAASLRELDATKKRNRELEDSLAIRGGDAQRNAALMKDLESQRARNRELENLLSESRTREQVLQAAQLVAERTEQHYRDLLEELEASQKKNRALKDQLALLQDHTPGPTVADDETTARLQLRCADLLDQVGKATNCNLELEKSIKEKQADIEELTATLQKLNSQDRYAALLQELEASNQRNEELDKKLAASQTAMQDRYPGILQELGATKQRNKELQKSLLASQANVQELKADLQRSEMAASAAVLRHLDEGTDNAEARAKHMDIFQAKLTTRCDALERENMASRNRVQALEEELVKKNSRILALRKALTVAEEKPSLRMRATIGATKVRGANMELREAVRETQDQAEAFKNSKAKQSWVSLRRLVKERPEEEILRGDLSPPYPLGVTSPPTPGYSGRVLGSPGSTGGSVDQQERVLRKTRSVDERLEGWKTFSNPPAVSVIRPVQTQAQTQRLHPR